MKAQVSVEFIAYLSFTLFVAAVLMGTMQDKQAAFLEIQEEDNAEDLASEVSYLAEYALTQPNSSFKAKLPLQLSSESYNLTVEAGMTYVEVRDEVFRSLNNYEGRTIDLKSGGSYRIVNNGSVYFEKG